MQLAALDIDPAGAGHSPGVRGLLRPCRHDLGPVLRERWRAHLCGLCLTLRDEAGQRARLLTGYDVLLLSVLVEAQAGSLPTETAGPCPLRGMRTADVVRADSPAMSLAAAGGLLAGAAGLADKAADGDLPRGLAGVGRRSGSRFAAVGGDLAGRTGLCSETVLDAPRRAAEVEAQTSAGLDELLAPSGAAVAEMFAHTADVAGVPANREHLRRAGDAFGRLVHLADAIEDFVDDSRHGRFNPLRATGTSAAAAYGIAEQLREAITAEIAELELVDPDLARALFGPTLSRAVRQLAPPPVPAQPVRTFGAVAAVTAAALGSVAVFGAPRRRRDPRYGDPRYGPRYDDPRYGDPRYDPRYDPYGGGPWGGRRYRRGPSCCDLLVCDCCANMACNEACGGDCCVCCI